MVGGRVVHLQAFNVYVTQVIRAVKEALCRGQVVATERAVSVVHHVASAAIVHTAGIRKVYLYRDNVHGNGILAHTHFFLLKKRVGKQCVRIGVIREQRNNLLRLAEIITGIFLATFG